MSTSTTNTTDTPLAGTGPTGHSPSEGQDSTTEQVKNTASVAQDEAKQVASDVREQARGLLTETRTQVEDQSRTQRDRLVETMRTFSDDLDGMAEQRGGLASDAAREVANRVRSFGQQLDGREPTELLDDLRSFARRRPGMFLAGSVIAGVVVGRFLRGSREAARTDSQTSGTGNPSGNQLDGPTHVAVTPQSRQGTSYDTTMTAEAPIAPLTSPLASPAVTSAESERPIGGM
jgi:ElaB/YqjD/DUF883 family membrane-anchored ribosome-binding protein